MTNNSSTGGPLDPTPPPAPQPVEDAALIDFFSSIITPLTDIPSTLVMPRWQPQMPQRPDINTNWIAIGINDRPDGPYGETLHVSNTTYPNGADVYVANENLELLLSVYGPNADNNAALIRDGIRIPQNREALQLVNMGLVGTSSPRAVPQLVNAQWYYRIDLTLFIQRLIVRVYPVLNLESLDGVLTAAASKTLVNVNFSKT